MIKSWVSQVCALALAGFLPGTGPIKAGAAEASFEEVYGVLKTNLLNTTPLQLQTIALQGLLAQLHPQAVLVTNLSLVDTNPPVAATRVHDGNFGYVRVARVEEGLAAAVGSAFDSISSTNKIQGWVLDLRFARGGGFQAAADTASLFLTNEQRLLQLDADLIRSRPASQPVTAPVTVLVNGQTVGAAEALAGMLRQSKVALILGTNTAGQAFLTRDLPLSSGQVLRVAKAPVLLADGRPIPPTGLDPDVKMATKAADEWAYLENPYRDLGGSKLGMASLLVGTNLANAGTNRGSRARINEAELVRRLREGVDYNEEGAEARMAGRARLTVNDPALARALDLLKALAVVNRLR